MATSSKPNSSAPLAGVKRSFTLPTSFQHSIGRQAQSTKEVEPQTIETLYAHSNARIVHFTTGGTGGLGTTQRHSITHSQRQQDAPGNLPWNSSSERTLAAGSFRIYRVPGSVAFLNAGASFLKPVLAKSQCWCVDGEGIFVLKRGPYDYYRIELPYQNEDDKAAANDFRQALDDVLLYEKTPCPFQRDFNIELPDSPSVTYIPWKPKHRPISPVRRQAVDSVYGTSPDGSVRRRSLVRSTRSVSRASSQSTERHAGDTTPHREILSSPTHDTIQSQSVRPTIGKFEILDKDHQRDQLLSRGREQSNARSDRASSRTRIYADFDSTAQLDVGRVRSPQRLPQARLSRAHRNVTAPAAVMIKDMNQSIFQRNAREPQLRGTARNGGQGVIVSSPDAGHILDTREHETSHRPNDERLTTPNAISGSGKEPSSATLIADIRNILQDVPQTPTRDDMSAQESPKSQGPVQTWIGVATTAHSSTEFQELPQTPTGDHVKVHRSIETQEAVLTSDEDHDNVCEPIERHEVAQAHSRDDADVQKSITPQTVLHVVNEDAVEVYRSSDRQEVSQTVDEDGKKVYASIQPHESRTYAPQQEETAAATDRHFSPLPDFGVDVSQDLPVHGQFSEVSDEINKEQQNGGTRLQFENSPITIPLREAAPGLHQPPDTPVWHSAADLIGSSSDESQNSSSTISSFVTAPTSTTPHHSAGTGESIDSAPILSGETSQNLAAPEATLHRHRSRSSMAITRNLYVSRQENYEHIGAVIGEKMAGMLIGPPLQLATIMLRIASRFTNGVRIRDQDGHGWERRGERGRRLPGTWESYSEDEGGVGSEWEADYGISIYGLETRRMTETHSQSPNVEI